MVAVPSTPYDVKGLMKSALREDCPVVFAEHKALYNSKGRYRRADSWRPSARRAFAGRDPV